MAVALVTLVTGAAFGQVVKVDPKKPGFGTDVFYGGAWDRSTVVTFKARIQGISKIPGDLEGQATDQALLVQTFSMAPDRFGAERIVFADGYLTVELGPTWFVEDQSTKLKVNDYVEITGSRMVIDGRRVVMAQTVRHAHNVLALRRLSGTPYWYAFKPKPESKPPTVVPPPLQDSGSTPPADDTPPLRGQPQSLGNSLIYGDAFSISGATNLPPGAFPANLQRVQPMGTPLVIIGNTWYGGPQAGYLTFPISVRF